MRGYGIRAGKAFIRVGGKYYGWHVIIPDKWRRQRRRRRRRMDEGAGDGENEGGEERTGESEGGSDRRCTRGDKEGKEDL